ncbi:hypothetical protein BG011_009489 [Mortierella polycephala]|uniref:Phosphatidylglycerol/phosphatidylinositol transfer protein n=1 Tax=Mortierella polycephala TaxID=41804 RepID=A0A9P6PP44_9FUNG|nr:hypothetical protein BG011_009489 [Mortierella polycephala]
MKFITAVAALIVATVANAQFDCKRSVTTGMNVTGFSLSPSSPIIGQTFCATITGTLNAPIVDGAMLAIEGKFLGRVIYTDLMDLCTSLTASGQPCPVPVPVTATSLTVCMPLKTTAASIPMEFTFGATDGNENIAFCEATTVTFSSG